MASTDRVWRVNRRPRFTILEMGEYMAADDGPRETMLRDMKYERLARSLTYRRVSQSVAGFLVSPTRSRKILEDCRERLEDDLQNAANPQQKQNISHELRALEAFERSLNALELHGVNFERVPAAVPMRIEGVRISVRPTAGIRIHRSRGADLIGAVIIDLAKGIEPKTDEAKARVRSGMTHAAARRHRGKAGY